jgi:membrane protein YqaA with SNARE-associated domain
MKIFSLLYDRVLGWAGHRHATYYLAALSFAESSFFPLPPDVMLAPMALAKPRAAWRLALLTTVASVLGGAAGYLIGAFAIDAVAPLIEASGYQPSFERARAWFAEYGFYAVLAAGFSPIPYKVFTIAAGAVGLGMPVFLAASVVGRGARFFLVAGLISWGGEPMERRLRRHVDILGWLFVVLLIGGFVLLAR